MLHSMIIFFNLCYFNPLIFQFSFKNMKKAVIKTIIQIICITSLFNSCLLIQWNLDSSNLKGSAKNSI